MFHTVRTFRMQICIGIGSASNGLSRFGGASGRGDDNTTHASLNNMMGPRGLFIGCVLGVRVIIIIDERDCERSLQYLFMAWEAFSYIEPDARAKQKSLICVRKIFV